MKKTAMATAISAAIGASAQADVGVMAGFTYTLGGVGPAVTVKVLSSDERHRSVAGIGVSYYPMANRKVGIDFSVGYQFVHETVVVGWDFLQKKPQLGFGFSKTQPKTTRPPPATTPAPAPVMTKGGPISMD